ncbi:MAG: hypothetical protein LBD53_03540 [Tannerella sp.]|nr:hypothetical protein [Tannerella sp.]
MTIALYVNALVRYHEVPQGRLLIAPTLIMTDVSSKPLAGFKTTARVWGTVIPTLNS